MGQDFPDIQYYKPVFWTWRPNIIYYAHLALTVSWKFVIYKYSILYMLLCIVILSECIYESNFFILQIHKLLQY